MLRWILWWEEGSKFTNKISELNDKYFLRYMFTNIDSHNPIQLEYSVPLVYLPVLWVCSIHISIYKNLRNPMMQESSLYVVGL